MLTRNYRSVGWHAILSISCLWTNIFIFFVQHLFWIFTDCFSICQIAIQLLDNAWVMIVKAIWTSVRAESSLLFCCCFSVYIIIFIFVLSTGNLLMIIFKEFCFSICSTMVFRSYKYLSLAIFKRRASLPLCDRHYNLH